MLKIKWLFKLWSNFTNKNNWDTHRARLFAVISVKHSPNKLIECTLSTVQYDKTIRDSFNKNASSISVFGRHTGTCPQECHLRIRNILWCAIFQSFFYGFTSSFQNIVQFRLQSLSFLFQKLHGINFVPCDRSFMNNDLFLLCHV